MELRGGVCPKARCPAEKVQEITRRSGNAWIVKNHKSYPAFYTHNKLKHDGKPPQHYDIPRSLEDIRKDRGRPRVTDSS